MIGAGKGNGDLSDFFAHLDQRADGSVELTEEIIRELKQKYDLHALTNEQKTALLLELNQKNILSYQECRLAKLSLVPLSLDDIPGAWEMYIDDEGRYTCKPKNENTTIFVDGRSHTPDVYFPKTPENIWEKYQDYEQRWRAEYQRLLREENKDVPACLAYADAYAHLAKIFKQLM